MTAALRIGPVTIKPASRTVRVNGRLVPQLTRKEFAVLIALADPDDPHRVRSRDELCRAVWPQHHPSSPVSTRTLDTHCVRLRRKFAMTAPDLSAAFVECVWGVGFRLVPLALAEAAAA